MASLVYSLGKPHYKCVFLYTAIRLSHHNTSFPGRSTEAAGSEGTPSEHPLLISPRFGAARLDPASSELRIVSLRPVDAGSSTVRVAVPEAVAKEFSGSLKDAPVTVEWRRGDGAWQSRTVPHRLLHLVGNQLTILAAGLGNPASATVRVTFNGETSAEVRGEDLVDVDGGLEPGAQTGTSLVVYGSIVCF